MATEYCPRCGAPRTGAFRFCRGCQFDFDGAPDLAAAAAAAPAPTPSQPMQHLGMLPSTRYKFLAIWVALLLLGWAYMYASNDITTAYAVFWFGVVTVPLGLVVNIWGGVRQVQVNLEWERRLRGR